MRVRSCSAHGFVAFVFPKDRLRARERLASECGAQAHSFHRLDDLALELARIFCAGEIDLDVADGAALTATALGGGSVRLSGTLESAHR